MEQFFDCLRKREFKIPFCQSCRRKAWPPSIYCPYCQNRTSMEKVDAVGTLLEFSCSRLNGEIGFFGIVELSGIRIIGSFNDTELHEGMKVKMIDCGVNPDGKIFYHFSKA